MNTQELDDFAKQIRDRLAPKNDGDSAKTQDAEELQDAIQAVKRIKLKPEAVDHPVKLGSGSVPKIDDYQILRQIGKGGMGVVFEARQISLDRQVALKLLSTQFVNSGMALMRFQREAKSAAALHHSNIVPVFDIGECNGHHYYAMQLIQGKTLREIIAEMRQVREASAPDDESYLVASSIVNGVFSNDKTAGDLANDDGLDETIDIDQVESKGSKPNQISFDRSDATIPIKKPMSEAETSKISVAMDDTARSTSAARKGFFHEVAMVGRQVANALAYAHRNGVIHRDIKPSNLLMDLQGNVWVADFGLAKTDEEDLTRTGDVIGTMRYMSPERFSGTCTESADIYALGVTLYELALLKPGFQQSDYLKLMDAIANKEPTKPSQVDPSIPADLETIILKSIEKDPRRRYTSAEDMSDDLLRFAEGRPINARHVSVGERAWIWAKRNPAISTLATVLVVGGLATIVSAVIAAASFRNMALTQKELASKATDSYIESQKNLTRMQEEKARGDLQAERALAVSDFLMIDILGQVETSLNYDRNYRADPNLTVRTALDRASKRADQAFANQPQTETEIRLTLGNAYRSVGAYTESVEELQRAFELAKRYEQEDDSLRYIIQHNLALSLGVSGRRVQAQRNVEQAMEGLIRTAGVQHPNSLTTMNLAAGWRYNQGKLDEARELYEKVIKVAEETYGVDCKEAMSAKTGLSTIHIATGKPEEALSLAKHVVDVYEAELGPDHLKTIHAQTNLADLHVKLNQTETAIEILAPAHKAIALQLGATHPDALNILEILGHAYRTDGQHETAIQLHERAMDQLKAQYGDQADTVLTTMNTVTDLYREVGRYEEAAELSQHVRTCRLETIGIEDERTLNAIYNYAALLRDTGELHQSVDAFDQVLQGRIKVLGPSHDRTITTMSSLAGVLRATGKIKQAIKYLEQAFDASVQNFGLQNAYTLNMMSNLGGAVRESGDPERAIKILEEARGEWLKLYPNGRPQMLPTLNNLAVAYSDVGREQESLDLQKNVYNLMKDAWGEDHRKTLNALANVAVGHWSLGQLDESVPLFEKVVQRMTDTQGRDHPKTLLNIANLAVNYRDAGRLDESIPMFEEAFQASKEYPRLRWIGSPLLMAYARKKSDKALPLADELLKQARATMDPKETDYANELYKITDAFELMNEHERIVESLQVAYEIYKDKKPDDWFVGALACRLGNSLRVQGEFEKSKQLLLEAQQVSETDPQLPVWVRQRNLNCLILLFKDLDDEPNVKKWRDRLAKFKNKPKQL